MLQGKYKANDIITTDTDLLNNVLQLWSRPRQSGFFIRACYEELYNIVEAKKQDREKFLFTWVSRNWKVVLFVVFSFSSVGEKKYCGVVQ